MTESTDALEPFIRAGKNLASQDLPDSHVIGAGLTIGDLRKLCLATPEIERLRATNARQITRIIRLTHQRDVALKQLHKLDPYGSLLLEESFEQENEP